MGEPVQNERVVPNRVTGERNVGPTLEHGLDHHTGFQARERRTDAEMDTPPECHMPSEF